MIAQVEERDRALEAKEQQLSRLTAQLDELSEPTGDLPAHPAPLSPGPPVLEELSQRVAQVEALLVEKLRNVTIQNGTWPRRSAKSLLKFTLHCQSGTLR